MHAPVGFACIKNLKLQLKLYGLFSFVRFSFLVNFLNVSICAEYL